MPPTKRVPKRFRVLWEAPGGQGYYEDVDAASDCEAAWKVALGLESGAFTGIIPVPAPAAATTD
jgi:hypothetical protein